MNFLRTRRALLTCAVFSAAALAPLAHAQQVLRVTTIPEEAATEQIRKFTPLASGLEKLSKLAKAGYKAVADEEEVEWDNFAVKAAETFGYLRGVPGTAQMSATGKYLWRVEEGEEEADNFAELLFYAAVGKRKESK